MKKALLCILSLLPLTICAQSNESDTPKTKASLSLTGFYQSGNVKTEIFRAQSEISVHPWRQSLFRTKNSYVYQEFGNQKADEDVLSLNFLILYPEKRLHPFLLGFVSSNFRRRIDMRLLTGGGVSYQILREDSKSLQVSVSGEYEQTDFASSNFNREEYDSSREINTIRGTIWISGQYRMFDNRMIINHESYYQPSLVKSDNYRWRADLGLELPLWKYLNFSINYRRTFESIVIEGQEQQDQILTFGFTVKSYE